MYNARLMVICSGPLATISCELRQIRKEATVAVISGAEVWLGQVTTLFFKLYKSRSNLCCNLAAFFDKLY